MSLSMELAQYYVPGRVTSFSDLATNTLGMAAGQSRRDRRGRRLQDAVYRRRRRPAGPDPAGAVVARLPALSVCADDRSAQILECAEADRSDAVAHRLRPVPPDRDLAHRLCADRGHRAPAPVSRHGAAVRDRRAVRQGADRRHCDQAGGSGRRWPGVRCLAASVAGSPRGCGPASACLVLCAYVVALRLEPFTFQASRTRIRLDAVPQPDAGIAVGGYAGVPGKVLPLRQHDLSARRCLGPSVAGGRDHGRAAVHDQLGGGLASRAFGRDHRYAHCPDRGGHLRSAACRERRRVSVDCSAAQCTGTAAPRLAAGAGARIGRGG